MEFQLVLLGAALGAIVVWVYFLGKVPPKQDAAPKTPLFVAANRVYLAITEHYRVTELAGKEYVVVLVPKEVVKDLAEALK